MRRIPTRSRFSRVLSAFALPCIALLCAVLLAPVASAGVHYTAVTTTEGPGNNDRSTVEGWVDGPAAKVVFQEGGANPALKDGQYILTRDAGKTLYLVDPKEKTYAEWDLEAMLASLGAMMESLGPIMNFKIENVEVTELGDEAGPEMLGLATRHHRFRTTYDMTMKVMGMGRTNKVDSEQEVWSTSAVDDEAMRVWLRNAPVTGFGELDELVEAEMGKVRGFPLKSVTRTTTTGPKGKRSNTTVMTSEVTSLDRSVDVPASTFELPEGYTESQGMLPAGEGEEESGNPLSGLFGGRGN